MLTMNHFGRYKLKKRQNSESFDFEKMLRMAPFEPLNSFAAYGAGFISRSGDSADFAYKGVKFSAAIFRLAIREVPPALIRAHVDEEIGKLPAGTPITAAMKKAIASDKHSELTFTIPPTNSDILVIHLVESEEVWLFSPNDDRLKKAHEQLSKIIYNNGIDELSLHRLNLSPGDYKELYRGDYLRNQKLKIWPFVQVSSGAGTRKISGDLYEPHVVRMLEGSSHVIKGMSVSDDQLALTIKGDGYFSQFYIHDAMLDQWKEYGDPQSIEILGTIAMTLYIDAGLNIMASIEKAVKELHGNFEEDFNESNVNAV